MKAMKFALCRDNEYRGFLKRKVGTALEEKS
jgi:hypothetical protein